MNSLLETTNETIYEMLGMDIIPTSIIEPSKENTPGATANASGKKLEDCVDDLFKLNGFNEIKRLMNIINGLDMVKYDGCDACIEPQTPMGKDVFGKKHK